MGTDKRFSAGLISPLQGTFGKIWRHFWHDQEDASGIQWVETRAAAKHPTKHKMPPTTETYPAKNVKMPQLGNAAPK